MWPVLNQPTRRLIEVNIDLTYLYFSNKMHPPLDLLRKSRAGDLPNTTFAQQMEQ